MIPDPSGIAVPPFSSRIDLTLLLTAMLWLASGGFSGVWITRLDWDRREPTAHPLRRAPLVWLLALLAWPLALPCFLYRRGKATPAERVGQVVLWLAFNSVFLFLFWVMGINGKSSAAILQEGADTFLMRESYYFDFKVIEVRVTLVWTADSSIRDIRIERFDEKPVP